MTFQVLIKHYSKEIISKEQEKKLFNNQYFIDFIKFILIKDPLYRPDINNVIERFEHIIGILSKTNKKIDSIQD